MNSIFKHILVIESSSDTNNFVLQRAVDVAKQNHVKITVFRSFYKEVHECHILDGKRAASPKVQDFRANERIAELITICFTATAIDL